MFGYLLGGGKKERERKIKLKGKKKEQTDSVSRAAFASGRSCRKEGCLAWGKVTLASGNHSQ